MNAARLVQHGISALIVLSILAAPVVAVLVQQRSDEPWLALIAALPPLALAASLWTGRRRKQRAMYRALAGTVASYRDGDYSFSLNWPHGGALGELVDAHNALGNTLREQRQNLTQRELLLDTVVQNTPVAILLVDPAQRVVLANLAARKLLGAGRRMEGQAMDAVLARAPQAMRDALDGGGDALFSVGEDDQEDIFHLSRRTLRLNGRVHRLLLLRQLTAELRRQEVQTWKKVIRVISHELNNSLAPIASLAHSSAQMLERGKTGRLPEALAVIADRARHLEGFIRDYARFARLPAPRREPQQWRGFLQGLRSQMDFGWDGEHADAHASFDPAQVQQALLNLLKNAHEAGGDDAQVQLRLRRLSTGWRIDVMDRGSGMNEAVIAQALLPFYSTKRDGTGLGLALVREIAEAHGGHVSLANREGGGLSVAMVLPDAAADM